MNDTVFIGVLVWIATGTTFGMVAARRNDALVWLIGGFIVGPLIAIALLLPRRDSTPRPPQQSVPRGGRR